MRSDTAPATSATPASRLLAGYKPYAQTPDELIAPDGTVRPHWAGLIAHLSAQTPAQTEAAFALGHQYLAGSGVHFRQYGRASTTRDWPLSPIPVILSAADWARIESGLAQRADLLERVVADVYGDNRLVADGHLPAPLIAANPEWVRPMVGVKPRSGHYLHFIAFEIGRGPDGGWWVLADRTNAPSGAGYALESRFACSRIFSDLYRSANVHRLAGFFRDFRTALRDLQAEGSSRPGLLTPGPMSETYDEHAYIARYLGLPLLEGEDMVVEDGKVRVRTIDGLIPIDVLWRRMDARWSDPLELDEDSQLGTPGLMSALRQGQVSMINALGAGILETQALMAFLPKISQILTGAPLAMPNIATWWCGQAPQLAHVRAHATRMMIGPALATHMPFENLGVHAIGGQLHGAPGVVLDDWITENAQNLVASELVTLSTTPAYVEGALVPRPITLRVFLARTATGWQAMPGGFARVGSTPDTAAVSMRQGGKVADVWVTSDTPVATTSLLAAPDVQIARAAPDPLPSQAADNLFWVGRYAERTEALLRLTRAYNARLDEDTTAALLARLQAHLASYGVDAKEPFPTGLLRTLSSAVFSASQIRDRFNVDAWAALMDMEKSMARMAPRATSGLDAAHMMSVHLRKMAGFSGLVHDNMHRTSAWQFLTLGRSLERAAGTADTLAMVADPKAPAGALDLAIEVGDSQIIHRQRYGITSNLSSVMDLLALDAQNPRSVLFHLDIIVARIRDLSQMHSDQRTDTVLAQALQVQSRFGALSRETMTRSDLATAKSEILGVSAALNAAFIH